MEAKGDSHVPTSGGRGSGIIIIIIIIIVIYCKYDEFTNSIQYSCK